jgi:APA family basic amino acid/polyamine antiporter
MTFFVTAAWVVAGVIALCGALSYGGLVKRMTESGGEYLFLSRVIRPVAGFIAGWVSLLAGFTGALAFAARVFETYALLLLP